MARRTKPDSKAEKATAPVVAPGAAAAEAPAAHAKNERVLHTRIPAGLEEDIKRAAEKLRIPVSNLVRNILEDALSLVGTVQKKVGEGVSEIRGKAGDRLAELTEAIRGPSRNGAEILAWQPIQVTRDMTCASCDKALAAGDDARLGVAADPSIRIFYCPACAGKPQRKRSPSKGTES